jgi:DNA-binding NarL/FixJ family response regulator
MLFPPRALIMALITSAVATSCKTVLLIEDRRDDRQYWAHLLRRHCPHYLVLEAADAQSGLDMCHHERVDCVLLDLDLPQVSGFQVLHDLIPHRTAPQIAVIVLTRLLSSVLPELAIQNGAHAYLIKDRTSIAMLDQAIQTALASLWCQPGAKTPCHTMIHGDLCHHKSSRFADDSC